MHRENGRKKAKSNVNFSIVIDGNLYDTSHCLRHISYMGALKVEFWLAHHVLGSAKSWMACWIFDCRHNSSVLFSITPRMAAQQRRRKKWLAVMAPCQLYQYWF